MEYNTKLVCFRLENLEFLPVLEISANRPFYLYELEEKVTSALDEARKTILRFVKDLSALGSHHNPFCFCSFIFRCAEHMWVHLKKWEHLVSREHGVSADLVRLFNCITSLVSSRLRAKTLASVHAWSQLLLEFQVSANWENDLISLFDFLNIQIQWFKHHLVIIMCLFFLVKQKLMQVMLFGVYFIFSKFLMTSVVQSVIIRFQLRYFTFLLELLQFIFGVPI